MKSVLLSFILIFSSIQIVQCQSVTTTSGVSNSFSIRFKGDDFEEKGIWNFSLARGIANLKPDAAFSGQNGLRLESIQHDSNAVLYTTTFKVEKGVKYILNWKARSFGGGTCIYIRYYNSEKNEIGRDEGRVNNEKPGWVDGKLESIPPSGAVSFDIFIQRPGFRPPVYKIDLDDFLLSSEVLVVKTPWEGTYKISPNEKNKLTEADVIGPDGLVYPDFTWAGVRGGIPTGKVLVSMKEDGIKSGQDISAWLEKSAKKVSELGGGVIELSAGDYYLYRPVFIFDNNVVIRGAGLDKTNLFFKYHINKGDIEFFRLIEGQEVFSDGFVEIHANPKDLRMMEIKVNNQVVDKIEYKDHWGNTFLLRSSVGNMISKFEEGIKTITGSIAYEDGSKFEKSIVLKLVKGGKSEPTSTQMAAINFIGRGTNPAQFKIQKDVQRGSREIVLQPNHGFVVGDKITIIAPVSERWTKLIAYESPWKIQAQGMYEIVAVEGNTIKIHQPVRYTFRVDDGSYVQKMQVVQGCGVEKLTLEQVKVTNKTENGYRKLSIQDLWTSGIVSFFGWNCWLNEVKVINACRNSVYFPLSKHIEIKNSVFSKALYKGDGGTGYIGFDRSWDCLMDNVKVSEMRHGPNVQWNASGNVVRNSRFEGSDGQWHAGFTLENLYENNYIDTRGNGGSYGYGLYASGPSSGLHGPQGPRNVVYNNDIISRKDAVNLGGGNEAWIIVYNKFISENGRAVFAKELSFDHIITGNIFILKNATYPVVYLCVDATGVELYNNKFFGQKGELLGFKGGITKIAKLENNFESEIIEYPDLPKVKSLYEWQMEQLKLRKITGDTQK